MLAIGLSIIFYGLYSSYNIFTAKVPAPIIFSVPVKEEIGKIDQSKMSKEQIAQQQMQESIMEGLKGVLPPDVIPKILNLTIWSIFSAILFWGGSAIAGLGIKLLKG